MKHLPLISLLILLVHFCNGQPTNDNKSTTALPLNRSKNPVTLSFGLEINRPFALKDSYINEAQTANPGAGFEFDVVLFNYFILGYNTDSYSFKTKNENLTGTTKTNLFFSRFKVGLRLPIKQNWTVDAFYYIEQSTALNSRLRGGGKLSDDVKTIMLGTRVNYFLSKSVACFVNLDFTNLKFDAIVPEPLSKFYYSENILGLSLGFSFYLERF